MKLSCIHCGTDFTITSEQLGGKGRCPNCSEVLEFPRGNADEQTDEKEKPASWMENSISGLGSIALHLILLILIAIIPWTKGSSGVGESYDVMIGELVGEKLNENQNEDLDLEQETTAEEMETEVDPLTDTPVEESLNDTLVQIDATSLSPSSSGSFNEKSLRSSSTSGGGEDFNGLIKRLKRDGLDIVITFDSTGSMGGEISVVKNKIRRIGSTLLKLIPKTRISICTYRDRGQLEEYVVKGTPLTNNLNEIISFLSTINAGGGGDAPEAVLDGLKWATDENTFRRRARKVILVFGDQPPHAGDQSECLDIASNFSQQQQGIISTVTCRRPSPLSQFYEIAKAGGGESFLTSDDREIMTQLLVLVFGNKHRKKVLEAFRLYDR